MRHRLTINKKIGALLVLLVLGFFSPPAANAQISTFLPYLGGIITHTRSCPCSFLQGRAVTLKVAPLGNPATIYVSSLSKRWTRGRLVSGNPIIVYKLPFFIEQCRRFSWDGCDTVPTPDGFTLRHGPGTEGGQP